MASFNGFTRTFNFACMDCILLDVVAVREISLAILDIVDIELASFPGSFFQLFVHVYKGIRVLGNGTVHS